jgi:S-(hydroxymethyl)glutathione dehydrogenase/alcohol dehydrogenase
MARKFGMTHFINPKDVENVVDAIVQLTDGGADYVRVHRQHHGDAPGAGVLPQGLGPVIIIGVAAAGRRSARVRSSW